MKKLFDIRCDGIFWVEEEGRVYSIFDYENNTRTYLDSNGKVIDNYTRQDLPCIPEQPVITDKEYVKDVFEGFYVYTTHEYRCDVDGMYGLFGIKYINGEKLTDEIYSQVEYFCNGLCSVCNAEEKWGCINTKGETVIPFKFNEQMFFNEYGVAVTDGSLIDNNGNIIPDTKLNFVDSCTEDDRYFVFSLLSDKQCRDIADSCTASGITVDIYDTKNRRYIVKGLAEDKVDVSFFHGEPDVVLEAVKLADIYNSITVREKGTLIGNRNGFISVYDYYKDEQG